MVLEHLKTVVVDTIVAHPHIGLLIVYGFCLLETLIVVGMFMPGTLFMTAIGILAGSHIMPLGLTLMFATLGAVTGDIISYTFGRHYHQRIRNLWPFNKWPELFTKGERFFERHGRKSLFLGRFIGPLRPILPMMLGMTTMPFFKFLIADVLSAAIWAPCYMLPGILAGAASQQLAPEDATRVVLILLIALLLIWVFSHLLLKILRRITDYCKRQSYKLWHYLSQQAWFASIYVFLRAKHKRGHHRQLNRLLIVIVTGLMLLLTSLSVYHHGIITTLNQPLYHLLQSLRSHGLDTLAYILTLFGQKQIILPCFLIIVLYWVIKREWWHALHYAAMAFLSVSGIVALKHLVHSARPLPWLHSFSFPSGHTCLSLSFFGIAAIFIAHKMHRYRWRIFLLAGVIYGLTACSRLYLGAHWLSDIIGSTCLGLACLLLVSLSWHRHPGRHVERRQFLAIVFIPFIIIASIYFAVNHKNMVRDYRPYFPIQMISYQQWLTQNEQVMPQIRKNRLGHATELLNIQWLGALTKIHHDLYALGFRDAPKNSLTQTLTRLAAKRGQHQLPLVPPTFYDRAPSLIMIKAKNAQHTKRVQAPVVIRLWRSPIQIKHQGMPLWLGSLTYQHRAHGLHLPLQHRSSFAVYPDASTEISQSLKHWRIRQLAPTPTAKLISYRYHPQRYRSILLIQAG